MTYGRGVELIGTVAVVDLERACELYGLAALPDPLGRSRPVGSVWLATRDVERVEDRLTTQDLSGIRDYVESLVRAEVCVECRTVFRHEERFDVRVHATRTGELAFVASQRRNGDGVDVVDIYSTAPEALGRSVVDALGLADAGIRWRITVVDGMAGGQVDGKRPIAAEPDDLYDDFGFPIPRTEVAREDGGVVVADGDVLAIGTVRSRPGPRAVDDALDSLRWVHVDDDGVYLFEHDESDVAEPIDAETLTGLIDGMVTAGLAAVRER